MLRIVRDLVPHDFGDQVILCPATMCHNEAEEVLAKLSLTERINQSHDLQSCRDVLWSYDHR
jgi:hypothetical protein